jgi:hypothetical protein
MHGLSPFPHFLFQPVDASYTSLSLKHFETFSEWLQGVSLVFVCTNHKNLIHDWELRPC